MIFQKNLCRHEYIKPELSIVGIAFDPESAMDRFDHMLLIFVAAAQLSEPGSDLQLGMRINMYCFVNECSIRIMTQMYYCQYCMKIGCGY